MASPDSEMPTTNTVLCSSVGVLYRERSLGKTSLLMTHSISNGTPGMETSTFPFLSNQVTGALPRLFCIMVAVAGTMACPSAVSYTHLRAHETDSYLVCRLLLEKKK